VIMRHRRRAEHRLGDASKQRCGYYTLLISRLSRKVIKDGAHFLGQRTLEGVSGSELEMNGGSMASLLNPPFPFPPQNQKGQRRVNDILYTLPRIMGNGIGDAALCLIFHGHPVATVRKEGVQFFEGPLSTHPVKESPHKVRCKTTTQNGRVAGPGVAQNRNIAPLARQRTVDRIAAG